MNLTSIYSTQTSRQERLNYFTHAIKKGQGRSLAFLLLDKKDRITLLALCNIKGSTVSWNKIGNQTLQNAIQQLIHGPRLQNLLLLPPKAMIEAHLTPFLTGKDLANLQSTHNAAPKLGNASSIIKNYSLAPLIARYCHQDCELLSESGKIQALHQLISMVQELSELEQLEVPSYQSIGPFFELIEARNLLRLSAQMHREHPLTGLENEQLQIAEDSATTLQRAETVRAWFGEHQVILQAFVELRLQERNLTLMPPEIGQLGALTLFWLHNNPLISLPKEIGQLRALTELWLVNNRLTSLPKEIGQLNAMTKLVVSDNRLTNLPKEIGQLGALTWLSCRNNRLTSLPKEIGQLRTLIQLELGNNHLSSLPKEIGQLGNLILLDLENNRLTSVTKEIGQLRVLIDLWLHHNRLTSLPKEIGQLRDLTHLTLDNNHLTSLPPEIGQLKTLTQLELGFNRLTSLPKEIGQLRALLTILNLVNNRLKNLPKELGQLGSLNELWLDNNRLTSLPKEIGKLQTLKALGTEGNGFLYLPAKLNRFKLQKQNQTLQMKTIISQLKGCLKEKHDCRAILALLNTMEKFLGKEIRSKLHACIYEVCKKEKSLHKKLKSSQFGRKAFVDPTIVPKFKLAALKRFEDMLKDAQDK